MSVEGYCGLFGSGKTYAMVIEAYNARKKDPELPIMANLGRLDLPGAPVQLIGQGEPLDDVMQSLVEFRGGLLLLDEVGVFLPSRLWNKMPAELCWKWAQLRKDGIELRWTCIRPSNAVKDLRDITFETHWCASWRRFGFFSVEDYSYTSVLDRRYFQSRRMLRFRKKLAGELYDTLGKVKAPGFEGSAKAVDVGKAKVTEIDPGGGSQINEKAPETDGALSGYAVEGGGWQEPFPPIQETIRPGGDGSRV